MTKQIKEAEEILKQIRMLRNQAQAKYQSVNGLYEALQPTFTFGKILFVVSVITLILQICILI